MAYYITAKVYEKTPYLPDRYLTALILMFIQYIYLVFGKHLYEHLLKGPCIDRFGKIITEAHRDKFIP